MDEQHDSVAQPHSLSVVNPALEDKSIRELQGLVNRDFVISRIRRQGGEIEIADDDTLLHVGDQILVVTTPRDAAAITAFIGRDVQVEWEQLDKRLISRRILITKPELNGKSLAQLKLHAGFGVSITRVNRAGVDLIAQPSLQLQMGRPCDGRRNRSLDRECRKGARQLDETAQCAEPDSNFYRYRAWRDAR